MEANNSNTPTPAATPAPIGRNIRMTYSHEAMADLILQDPTVSPEELAEVFNYTVGWVNQVLRSGSFQVLLAKRKAQLVDPIISQNIQDKLRGVTFQALDIVSKKLETEEGAALAESALQLALATLNPGQQASKKK